MRKKKESHIVNTKKNVRELKILKSNWLYKGMILGLVLSLLLSFAYNEKLFLRGPVNIPYVVELNTGTGEQKINNAVSLESYTYTEQVMLNTVRTFITKLRRVGTDSVDNRERISWVCSYCTGDALAYVKNYYNENHPNIRKNNERVEAVVYNAMPIKSSGLKFQVDWNETVYNSNNKVISERNYRADIEARQYKSTKDTNEINPLGFYVTYIYISPIKDGFVQRSE